MQCNSNKQYAENVGRDTLYAHAEVKIIRIRTECQQYRMLCTGFAGVRSLHCMQIDTSTERVMANVALYDMCTAQACLSVSLPAEGLPIYPWCHDAHPHPYRIPPNGHPTALAYCLYTTITTSLSAYQSADGLLQK